jgi:hypothetical protein
MDTSAKPKEKSVSSQLIWTTDYEIVSPLNVSECVFQLKVLKSNYQYNNTPFWNISYFRFDDLASENGIVHFGIKADTGKLGINGKALGRLIAQADHKTLVKLEIGYTYSSVVLQSIIAVIFNMILLIGFFSTGGLCAALVIDLLLIILPLASASELKRELYTTIYQSLTDTKVHRPQTLPP